MAELVAGAFLSSFLQVAFDRLASPDFLDFFRRKKLDEGLLKNLLATLLSVDKVIEDAEERQYRDPRVKQWLHLLKDEVFTAQDLLDDISTEASLQNLNDEESQTPDILSQVRGYVIASVDRNKFEKEIESEIRQVLQNLENLMEQNKILGLGEGPSAGIQLGVNKNVPKRVPATLLIDESDVYGRDADKKRIGDILLSPNMGGSLLPMDVIAITGMGGMGKTTLARLVYEEVKDRFQHTAWVCVSEVFDVRQVTKAILQSLNCPTNLSQDFHSDQLKLKETLMNKKFFLVLDDVWSENYEFWEVLLAPFKHAAPQSKILVTTRSTTVAEVMCCSITHPLKPLQDGDCWNLFAKHAFNNQHLAADPDFVQIGGEIVKKCGGLPLAIKTLGSLLRRKPSFQYWDRILRSAIWQLAENDSNIIPSLRLSYHYLPSNLKRCFAYCSIFPKDYVIDKNVLVQLWMADGLIYPPQKGMSLEELGDEIFNDLSSRSFFEPSSRNGDSHFIMHDLLNDLAKSVAGEFFVHLEQADEAEEEYMSTKTRYLSYTGNECAILEPSKKVFECHRLRSFLLLNMGIDNTRMDDDIVSRLSHLKYIRQLSLRGHGNLGNLMGISNLKHLHYLDLSYTSVEKLPSSTCLLINLQTPKLRRCSRLTGLPSDLYKLIKLRHLDLKGSPIQKMPNHMGRLNQLRTMNTFVVTKEGGSDIKELGALKHLTGSLTISNMKYINDATDAREANLKEKKLVTLKLQFYWLYKQSHEEGQHEEQVLEAIEPNQNVKELTVEIYRGTKFPKWLGGSHFVPNLVSLFLLECHNCVSLPPLGQLPSLQKLTIKGFDGIKVIGEEFYGKGSLIAPFPRLSYLKLSHMGGWEEWDVCYEGESFPCLEELHIWGCGGLKKSLPQHLPCLKTLNIEHCGNLETTLPKSSSMERLSLKHCEKITVKDMPTWSISDVLQPLYDLSLTYCVEMESLPKGGMLSNLQRLSIFRCPKVIASGRDCGLHELLSLKHLEISCDFERYTECFPEEGLLPPNLQSLSLTHSDRLRSINHRGLVHLYSLTSLSFAGCRSMSFEGMPRDGFPPSLSHLTIGHYCPLLKERCEKDQGPDWPKIAHIPRVDIL